MQRTVNLVIGLAVIVGVSVLLFGSIGGGPPSTPPGAAPPSGVPGALPQLEMASDIVGPSSSEPPPIPASPRFTPPRRVERLEAIFADPSPLAAQRRERARQRLRRVFGGELAIEQESAVEAAVETWVAMQVRAVAAFQHGYLDGRGLGLHTGWNRNVYILAVQAALGNEGFHRYARMEHERDSLQEIDPL